MPSNSPGGEGIVGLEMKKEKVLKWHQNQFFD
jgi:hypothetical protein